MEHATVMAKIVVLAREQFKENKQEITRDSTAADIAGWNSLSHVMLIGVIEKAYGIKFDLLQMIDMQSIGDIADKAFELIQNSAL